MPEWVPPLLFFGTIVFLFERRFFSESRLFSIFSYRGKGLGQWEETIRGVMVAILILAVLGVSLYIIVSRQYDAESERWVFGTVGVLLGYWLKE